VNNNFIRASVVTLLCLLIGSCASKQTGSSMASNTAAGAAPVAANSEWRAIAFGQSVDVNFATSILPAKVGTNNVWFNGAKLGPKDVRDLNGTITIESRGGKIANAHDGITFYYTRLPTDQNFVLEADVTVEQFGPEINANPNGQEAVGLMVRDVLGGPRQEPLQPGYEEFPAASNMAVNAAVSKNRRRDTELAIQTIYRDGVNYPWGNPGTTTPKGNYAEVDFGKTPTFKMKLERTNNGFIATYANADGSNPVVQEVRGANANIVQTIDSKNMYVGFFAARNARATFKNAKLTVSQANTVNAPKFQPREQAPTFALASPDVTATDAYLVQARASVDGTATITQDGNTVATLVPVKGGKLLSHPVTIRGASSTIQISFVPTGGAADKPLSHSVTVTKKRFADPSNLYAAPNGKIDAAGTRAAPLDLEIALKYVAHGGTVHLLDGTYSRDSLVIPLRLSGSEGKLKKLVAVNKGKAVFTNAVKIEGHYWHVKGIEVAGVTTGNGVRITGSHNIIEEVVVHGSADTGLQITAGPGVARSLWPSYNLVLNSESFNNMDEARKNADGFAAKIGVGDGNVFRGCIAHHNVDDGWDLYNKIEDDRNGVVTIENSIAYNNGITFTYFAPTGSAGNGFKLGGEGLPVPHVIRNSIAFNNNMDGFTDNFNPGALVVQNNVAFNNARFNYIFRAGPFATPAEQGRFNGNISLRTYKGIYSDVVVGVVDGPSNYFYDREMDKSTNGAGASVTPANFVSLAPPLVNRRLQRDAKGNVMLKGFLQRR
jgi:pectate disaccharide-lyase